MIYEQKGLLGFEQYPLYLFRRAREGIEVHTANEVGILQQLGCLIFLLVEAHDALCAWQPLKEVRIHIRHYDCDVLALLLEVFCPRKD